MSYTGNLRKFVLYQYVQGRPQGEATGAFFLRPQPERGLLNDCLKDRYTLIEQSRSRYFNRVVTVSEEQCSKLIYKEIYSW